MRPDAISGVAAHASAAIDAAHSTDAQRAALFTRVMGLPGGSADSTRPNQDFQDLWLRFVSAVSVAARNQHLTGFASNATRAFASEAGPRIEQARRDMWQAVDTVATLELGGAVNSARHRTLALAGSAVLDGLARHDGRSTDPSLLDACETWLAASTCGDGDVERLSEPAAARSQVDAWSGALCRAVGLPDAGADRLAALPRATAVFAGPSGTGKTLAAAWLASTAGKEVYRVDVGSIVSRYIGETEKNLDRVFGAAHDAGWVLLFDEADALMGKRTEVREAHDRYANSAVDALAARLATFDGLALIATQQDAQAIDPRLLARVDARVVPFPLPPRSD